VSAESCWLGTGRSPDRGLLAATHVLAASVRPATGSRILKLSAPVHRVEVLVEPDVAADLARAANPACVRYSSRDDRTTWVIWLSDWPERLHRSERGTGRCHLVGR